MAGTQVHNVGTIFSRVTGMLRKSVWKWEDRPLWYDVYKTFPPKYEPTYDRPVSKTLKVVSLIYPEDEIRAQFYKTFGSPGLINLTDNRTMSLSETFVQKYIELANASPDADAESLFNTTAEALQGQGIKLRRKDENHPVPPAKSGFS